MYFFGWELKPRFKTTRISIVFLLVFHSLSHLSLSGSDIWLSWGITFSLCPLTVATVRDPIQSTCSLASGLLNIDWLSIVTLHSLLVVPLWKLSFVFVFLLWNTVRIECVNHLSVLLLKCLLVIYLVSPLSQAQISVLNYEKKLFCLLVCLFIPFKFTTLKGLVRKTFVHLYHLRNTRYF